MKNQGTKLVQQIRRKLAYRSVHHPVDDRTNFSPSHHYPGDAVIHGEASAEQRAHQALAAHVADAGLLQNDQPADLHPVAEAQRHRPRARHSALGECERRGIIAHPLGWIQRRAAEIILHQNCRL